MGASVDNFRKASPFYKRAGEIPPFGDHLAFSGFGTFTPSHPQLPNSILGEQKENVKRRN